MKWQEDLLLEPWLGKSPEKNEKSDKAEKADRTAVERAAPEKAPGERPAEKSPPAPPREERKWGRR